MFIISQLSLLFNINNASKDFRHHISKFGEADRRALGDSDIVWRKWTDDVVRKAASDLRKRGHIAGHSSSVELRLALSSGFS